MIFPHPLTLLEAPLTKLRFKKLVKSKIVDYWEQRLRAEAKPLTSLEYFKPEYMSLTRPHPIWWSAGCNPFEISKAVNQSRMLSGRYRTRQLTSNWSAVSSCCPSSSCITEVETLEHILLYCPEYELSRSHVVAKQKILSLLTLSSMPSKILPDTSCSSYLMQQSFLK